MSVQCMACDNLLLLLGSFHDACLKLKQAEDTSNIESSQEDDIGIRRGRRVQKKKDVVIESRDSSSDSELDLDNSLFLAPPTTQISEDQFDITIGKLTGLTSIFIFLNIYIFNLFCCQESTGDQPHPPDENNQQVAVVPEIPQPVIVQEDFDVEQDPKLFLATAADTADIKSLIEGMFLLICYTYYISIFMAITLITTYFINLMLFRIHEKKFRVIRETSRRYKGN